MRKILIVAAGCALVTATAARSAPPVETGTPDQVRQLIACRAVADAQARLACFDQQSAAFAQAVEAKNLVVVDKEKARVAKRSLFGFSVPNFGGIFGGDDDEVTEIEGTIEATGRNADGGWIIYLADGSAWSQTDDWPGLDPRRGKKVIIKRAALGSFRLMIPGQNGIKVKRIG